MSPISSESPARSHLYQSQNPAYPEDAYDAQQGGRDGELGVEVLRLYDKTEDR